MNNAARGVILALSLMGSAFVFIGTISSIPEESDFKANDLADMIFSGFIILSCAVMGAAALAGMKPSEPKQVTLPYQQQPAVPPQQQPYQQPYQQQYAQQPYAPQPQQPRQD